MGSTLLEWHTRLAAQFDALAESRSASRGLFALEHGLDVNSIAQLQVAVRQAAKSGTSDSRSALPWIVYATEVGYGYSGDEYWQTFEDETPGWAENWDRAWLRDQFEWFHKKYRGVRPTGAWAQHFSIICWPIANAILPRDLQLQLARILFEIAFRLNSQLLHNPQELGQVIANFSWGASPRFQNLLQEPLLIGQIATALLLEGDAISKSLILPATLRRIGADLERQQQSKEWLKRARGIAVERLRAKGFAPKLPPAQRPAQEHALELPIQPTFLLRPSLNASAAWAVILELPNLSGLLEYFPEARDALLNSRCVIAGSDGRPLARGRLLKDGQKVVLTHWPKSGEQLVKFEKSEVELDFFLRSRLTMSRGEAWLFRIASDGLGYEVRTASVRTAQRYLLLRRGVSVPFPPGAEPVVIECDGITGAMFRIPEELTKAHVDGLKASGISVSKGIRVWPVGVPPISWNGEGRLEYLTTEHPCVAILADHDIAHLAAATVEQRIELGALKAGEPCFLACDRLPPGLHRISLESKGGLSIQPTVVGEIEIFCRPPRAWEAGTGTAGPLLLDIDPLRPTLEQLYEGQVDVVVRGPASRHLACQARLLRTRDDKPLLERSLPNLGLPITAEAFNRHIQRHFFGANDVHGLYDSANSCELDLNGAELGVLHLRFERETSPVRWAVRTRGRTQELMLVTDALQDQPVTVGVRAFSHPHLELQQEGQNFARWHDVGAQGGLYVARVSNEPFGIVLPPLVHDLKGLQLTIDSPAPQRSPQGIRGFLDMVYLWGSAKLAGNLLSGERQRRVLRHLVRQLQVAVVGERWKAVEETPSNRLSTVGLAAFEGRPFEYSVAVDINAQVANLAQLACIQRVEWLRAKCQRELGMKRVWRQETVKGGFASYRLVGAQTPADSQWLCEFALRLASAPVQLKAWAGGQFEPALSAVLQKPMLARLARYFVLAIDAQHENGARALFSGWDWR